MKVSITLLIYSVTFVILLAVFSTEGGKSIEEICAARNKSCSFCTLSSKCFWCDVSQSCHYYKIIPKGCGKAQWFIGQCSIAGYWLIIVIPSVVGVFLLICLLCCCWRCCCKVEDKGAAEEKMYLRETKRKADSDRRRTYHEERSSKREVQDDRVRSKTNYGLFHQSKAYEKMNES